MKIIIIIITTLLSILTMSVYAESSSGVFNFKIPQPDIISNDWDGDGIPNSQDNDDDNDGIDDVNDSLPFGHNGQNSSSLIIFNSFTSDKSDISSGDTINLSWDIDNKQNLNIYTDSNLIELVQDVSDLNSLELSPSETTTYYLDYGAGIADITIEVLQVPSAEGSSYTVSTSVLGTSIGNVSFSRMSQSYYQNSSYDSSINMSFTTTHSANNGYVYKYGIIEITFPEAKRVKSLYMDGSLVFNYQRCGVTNSGRWACTLGNYMNTQNGDGGDLKFSYTCILNGSRTSLGSDNSDDLSFDFGGIMCDKVELKVPFYISDNKWQHYDKTFYINELYFY